jgi:CRISPR-associated protein Cmr2
MSDSLLFFTFGPVQSFIQEARRAEDLFNGSRILSELAEAAAQAIGEPHLIYPASLAGDTPNMLVARLPESKAADLAQQAEKSLHKRWMEICKDARGRIKVPTDETWNEIWNRQTAPNSIWEVYWVAVPISAKGYAEAYIQAGRALDAVKRSRIFLQAEEKGQKDSLSGRRAALHTEEKKARDYWAEVANWPGILPSKVRPQGRERLDAIGAVKRFAELQKGTFSSTSTVAAADFLALAKSKGLDALHKYRDLLKQKFNEDKVFQPRKSDRDWPYDGDLLYETTLTVERFKTDYNFTPAQDDLQACVVALKKVYEACGNRPSPYYAILVLDGDKMGEKIDGLLKSENPETAHRKFSQKLGDFSKQVKPLVDAQNGFLVYNGGDDVLCMAPLSKAIPLAKSMADTFKDTMSEFGVTESAGIAIAHHQSPMDFAIEEARRAEKAAKNEAGRNAVCVYVLKRSGEPLEVRSQWKDLKDTVNELKNLFEEEKLSSRLAYSVQCDAPVLAGMETDARKSGLKVLLTRQSAEGFKYVHEWADRLNIWATNMDDYLPEKDKMKSGFTEMANWLILSRFLAEKGGE